MRRPTCAKQERRRGHEQHEQQQQQQQQQQHAWRGDPRRRATNRIDKPEWAFTHLIESIRDHSTFLVEVLQPWINDVEGTTYVDMQAAFAQVLVAAARHRIENLVLPVLMPAAAATGGTGRGREIRSKGGGGRRGVGSSGRMTC